MRETLQLALQPSVVKRALKFAVVVGIVLISINHGDAILKHEVTRGRILKMALTVLVPYVVSTLSSVQAMRERSERELREGHSPAPGGGRPRGAAPKKGGGGMG